MMISYILKLRKHNKKLLKKVLELENSIVTDKNNYKKYQSEIEYWKQKHKELVSIYKIKKQ